MNKKRVIIIVVSLLIIITIGVLISLKPNSNTPLGEKSNIEITNEDVLLSIKQDTLTSTGVTIILENTSDNDITYGSDYEIEKYENNAWYKIDVELYFTSRAFNLASNDSVELNLSWKSSYGKLKPGKYRIIKNYNYTKSTSLYTAVEFEID